MSEDLLTTPIEGSVYKIRTIRLATFFGGPLAGGYMIATNFKTFGDEKKSKITWIITVLAILGIFSLGLLPALSKVPGYLYAIVYFGLANYFANAYQEAAINLHLENGGTEFSKGNAILVSILGLLLIFAFLFAIVVAEDVYFKP